MVHFARTLALIAAGLRDHRRDAAAAARILGEAIPGREK
jgi:hypothetical protein